MVKVNASADGSYRIRVRGGTGRVLGRVGASVWAAKGKWRLDERRGRCKTQDNATGMLTRYLQRMPMRMTKRHK